MQAVKLSEVLREAKRVSRLTRITERGIVILRKTPIFEKGVTAIWLPTIKLWVGFKTPKRKGVSNEQEGKEAAGTA